MQILHKFYSVHYLQIPRNKTTFGFISHETKQPMTTETHILNDHNKAEFPPMHTGESGVSSILQ